MSFRGLSCVKRIIILENSSEGLSPEVRALILTAEKELQRVVSLSAELIRKPV